MNSLTKLSALNNQGFFSISITNVTAKLYDISEEATKIHENSPHLFTIMNNLALYYIRSFAWWIIRGLCWLVDAVEQAVNVILKNLDFFSSIEVGLGLTKGGVFSRLMPIFWTLLVLGMVIVGYKLVTHRAENKTAIPTNIILVVVLVLGMPTMLNLLNNITGKAVDVFSSDTTIAQQVITNNVYDLLYLDSENFRTEIVLEKNKFGSLPTGIPPQEAVDATEVIDHDDAKNGDVFKYFLKYDSNGEPYYSNDANDAWVGGDPFSIFYYRFKIQWFTIFISLVILLIAFTLTAIRAGKIIFEIAYNGIFMMFIAPLDISTGQRTKKILNEIINLFAVLIAIMFCYKLYSIGMTWSADTFEGIPLILVQAGFSWALIDGPDVVQRVLGIDAGLKNVAGAISGAVHGAQAIGGIAKAGVGLAKGAASVATAPVRGAGVIAAAMKGAKDSADASNALGGKGIHNEKNGGANGGADGKGDAKTDDKAGVVGAAQDKADDNSPSMSKDADGGADNSSTLDSSSPSSSEDDSSPITSGSSNDADGITSASSSSPSSSSSKPIKPKYGQAIIAAMVGSTKTGQKMKTAYQDAKNFTGMTKGSGGAQQASTRVEPPKDKTNNNKEK